MVRVLALIEQPENQKVFSSESRLEYEVVTARSAADLEGLGDIDLIVTEPPTLHQWQETLQQLREEAYPLFLPLVVLLSREEAERAPLTLWDAVDEVLIAPVLGQELQGRLQSLLRTRELSLLVHAELTQILDSSANATCVILPSRKIHRSNQAFRLLVGSQASSLRGKKLEDVFESTTLRTLSDAVQYVLQHEETCLHTLEINLEETQSRTLQLTVSPFRGLNDELLGAILDFADVTALKQSETSLRESKALLEKALSELKTVQGHLVHKERLHALGQMASGIVHDFNNTLSVILGYAEMLEREGEVAQNEETKKCLSSITTAARDAAYIVRGLRGFYKTRSDDDPHSLLSINDVVAEAIALTRPRWFDEAQARKAPIKITRNLGRIPRLMANESELREALTNLIFNAVDAMPEGGELTFVTRREDDTALVEISDTGVGMDEATTRAALEPFFTTKGEKGTGLGLAMTFGIVSRHKGTIEIQSQPGQGATIIIRLPLESSHAPAVEVHRASMVSLEPLRILVVDDHPAVRESFKRYLEKDGHTVTIAEDGIVGLDAFHEDKFDAVITDSSMPNLDGLRFAAVIKATSPSTPVIMVTAQDCSHQKAPANVDILLQKPVPLSDLRRALGSAIYALADLES